MNNREKIIAHYIQGHNEFDTIKMSEHLHPSLLFENIQNGVVTMSLNGLEAFLQQAEEAKSYFTTRKQTVISMVHSEYKTEVEIDYEAVLAMDFPNGMKKGDELRLKGKSVFEFRDGKIVKIRDIS